MNSLPPPRERGATTTHARRAHSLGRRGVARALACAWLALPCAALSQDKDTVQIKGGPPETGVIKAEEYGGVSITPTKGQPHTIEWAQIAPDGISYAGSPEYASAKESLISGKPDDALQKFEALKGESKLRAVLKQNVLYYIAMLEQRKGDYDGALATMKELVTAFPKSRYLMDVGERTVACYAAKKDVASANRALDELVAAANAGGIENGFGSAVNVLKGRVFELQGDFAKAQAAYGVAASATGVPQTVVFQARLGQGRCAVALKKSSDAESIFRALTKEDAPNSILAGAWNGLGDLLKDEARKGKDGKPDGEKVLDALFAYLRGSVQYAPLPGESTDEYERSLRGSSDCFKFLSDLETKPDQKKLNRDRSVERLEVLKKEYPNSAYIPH
jgi:tetratricopeptide (TPR) repeat protein